MSGIRVTILTLVSCRTLLPLDSRQETLGKPLQAALDWFLRNSCAVDDERRLLQAKQAGAADSRREKADADAAKAQEQLAAELAERKKIQDKAAQCGSATRRRVASTSFSLLFAAGVVVKTIDQLMAWFKPLVCGAVIPFLDDEFCMVHKVSLRWSGQHLVIR